MVSGMEAWTEGGSLMDKIYICISTLLFEREEEREGTSLHADYTKHLEL